MVPALIEPPCQTKAHAGGAKRRDERIAGKGRENELVDLRIIVRTDLLIMLHDLTMLPADQLGPGELGVKLHQQLASRETLG